MPLFFNGGIRLEAEAAEETETARPGRQRSRGNFYGCSAPEPEQ